MTAISAIKAQSISHESLCTLLGSDGLSSEALGAGLRESLKFLARLKSDYELPEWVGPDLEGFEYHLRGALADLEHALLLAQSLPWNPENAGVGQES